MECSAQEQNILLVIAYSKDVHAAGFETHLLMRCTYNKGLTNPKYKSTPQDLTNEKGGEESGMQAQGNQGEFPFICIKATNTESLRSMF
jgi:hypothetical protein